MSTYALGIQERIDGLRGLISRIEVLRDRYRKLETDPKAGRREIDNARDIWRAHMIELGSQWETIRTVIEHYQHPEPATPAAHETMLPLQCVVTHQKTALNLPPSPEARRARYLANKGL